MGVGRVWIVVSTAVVDDKLGPRVEEAKEYENVMNRPR